MNLNRTKNNKSQPNHLNSGSLFKLGYKYLQIQEVSFQTHQFIICLSSPWSSRFQLIATNQPRHSRPSRNSSHPRHETVLAISKRGWFANPPNFQKRNCRLENARRLRRLLQEDVNPEIVGILFLHVGGRLFIEMIWIPCWCESDGDSVTYSDVNAPIVIPQLFTLKLSFGFLPRSRPKPSPVRLP